MERLPTNHMKRLIAFAVMVAALAPAVAAQTSAGFTGKWEGTFTMQRPDGREGDPRPVRVSPTRKREKGQLLGDEFLSVIVGVLVRQDL